MRRWAPTSVIVTLRHHAAKQTRPHEPAGQWRLLFIYSRTISILAWSQLHCTIEHSGYCLEEW
jgi:hypothetical protein